MMVLDGSAGEGGGQILRSSLSLSLATGKPFELIKIRAGRRRPGLMRQHLTAVKAAARIGNGRVIGDTLGSTRLVFEPGEIAPGRYSFETGTAGSAMLVLQTLLLPLALAEEPSFLELSGGTHNPFAPPFDFVHKAFLPVLERMGARVTAEIRSYGFYPAGGGRVEIFIQPAVQGRLSPFELMERGPVRHKRIRALLSRLPAHIAQREIRVVQKELSWPSGSGEVVEVDSRGPGNALMVEVGDGSICGVFTAFGARGVRAEAVAVEAAGQARDYLALPVPVEEHLADQLLLPMAMARGGGFRTKAPSSHTLTNMDVIRKFMDVEITCQEVKKGIWEIRVVG